tara:strand:+ start:2052 stop:2240 length:189 start_codon:yes stop_codon:yes gene_type:complete
MSNMQERHEEYMKRMIREEDEQRENIVVLYNNMRLTKELEELKNRVKTLETDMAYKLAVDHS